ncbi:transmembrane protein 154 [Suncus etruscus]|uniref:transmembrane protein 154 n=1 Tax=Suncus etruscus TaxID=109475 RepID=UPI00210FBEAC|nr:transmembrane protein 154 [Suncus etruscus]
MGAPGAVLLGVLLLWLLPTGQAQSYPEDLELSESTPEDAEMASPSTIVLTVTDIELGINSTTVDEQENQSDILMLVIPLSLVAFLILLVIVFVIFYKRKRAKQEPSSQGSQNALQTCELGSENLKVPIFEEDTPSVMEIEMEELDKWMSTKHEDCVCLPPLKEEKEPNLSPRNCGGLFVTSDAPMIGKKTRWSDGLQEGRVNKRKGVHVRTRTRPQHPRRSRPHLDWILSRLEF